MQISVSILFEFRLIFEWSGLELLDEKLAIFSLGGLYPVLPDIELHVRLESSCIFSVLSEDT
ncbi:hypothetical protein AT705_20345 [Pseudoalteromonas rubra]|uniref:Uncharacterized protein n=1 Tax=Pseudoalteromonas rubra TaxID=43658 RepID=A0A0U2PDZ4_9GAMM|nr:hypothetical protein AT705_20345 [Pseudoalteromonas rubra]